MRIVNPYTAWAHLTMARQAGARTIVLRASASALGQMVNRLARLRGVQVINIVRRDAQAETLRGLGAGHILNSAATDFDRQLDARLAFDAVAGAMTPRLLNALPPKARVVVYGGLAGEFISVNPAT